MVIIHQAFFGDTTNIVCNGILLVCLWETVGIGTNECWVAVILTMQAQNQRI